MAKRKYFVGDIYSSNFCGDYTIVDYKTSKKVLVRFIDTGFSYWTSVSRIVRGEVKDPSLSRVFGVGINDVDYVVETTINGVRVTCPFYRTWRNMLARCYYEKNRPTYVDAVVVEQWWRLSAFKAWMETQDWQGKELDKDLLVRDNKIYGPDTCVFINSHINLFLIDNTKKEGALPSGVKRHRNAFTAVVGINGKPTYLGSYATVEEAEQVYKKAKKEQALLLAEGQSSPLVAAALIERYA